MKIRFFSIFFLIVLHNNFVNSMEQVYHKPKHEVLTAEPKNLLNRNVSIVCIEGQKIQVQEELLEYSETLKIVRAMQSGHKESEHSSEIIITEISIETFKSIIELLDVFHKRVVEQRTGKISDRQDFIIGDDKVVSKEYVVGKNAFKVLSPTINKNLGALKSIIEGAHFLDIHWLKDITIAHWLICYILDAFNMDFYTHHFNSKESFLAIEQEEKIIASLGIYFMEDLHEFFIKQLHYLTHAYYSSSNYRTYTITDLILFSGDMSGFFEWGWEYGKKIVSLDGVDNIRDWKTSFAQKVTELNFCFCKLNSIPHQFLEDFVLLKSVALDFNKFKEIRIENDTLEIVNLEKNQLKKIFLNCPHLKTLKLNNNNLDTIPENLFSYLPLLERLYIENNPIQKKMSKEEFVRDYLKEKNIHLNW